MALKAEQAVQISKVDGLYRETGYAFEGERRNSSLDDEKTEMSVLMQGIVACSNKKEWDSDGSCESEQSSSGAFYEIHLWKGLFQRDAESRDGTRLVSAKACLRQLFGTSLDDACSFPVVCGRVSLYNKSE